LLRHIMMFGLPFLSVPVALARRKEREPELRLALIFAGLIGFVVPNFVIYKATWDIVKFYGLGVFFGNVLLADLATVVRRRTTHATALALVGVVILATISVWPWLLRFSIFDGRWGVPRSHGAPGLEVTAAIYKGTMNWVAPKDRVLATAPEAGM